MKSTLRTRALGAALALALASATAQADMKDDWIAVAHAATAKSEAGASQTARGASLVLQAIERASHTTSGGNGGTRPENDSAGDWTQRRDASVAMATFAVLEHLYPEAQADLEVKLALSLEGLPENDAKAEGLVIGRRIAAEVLGRQ